MFAEHCALTVDNQTGKTLRVTPINTDGNSASAVRLYRTTFPIFAAYQQRDIVVESGDQIVLYFDCETKVSELHVCDQEGECYLRRAPYKKVTFQSLEALSHPDAALQATIQSFPEHSYSVGINVLLCLIQIIAFLGGLYWLKRTKPAEIPHDI